MTNAQMKRIHDTEVELKSLLLINAPRVHMKSEDVLDAQLRIINRVRNSLPNYAVYGLQSYADALYQSLKLNHIVQVYVTTDGKIPPNTKEFTDHVERIGGWSEAVARNYAMEMVYRDDYTKQF